ncbi:MAG: hypothetical protein MRZ61_10585 [Oscillospiraceae bacterium]|nr:hypothetical protein [Oscillospiraceae bacterium]
MNGLAFDKLTDEQIISSAEKCIQYNNLKQIINETAANIKNAEKQLDPVNGKAAFFRNAENERLAKRKRKNGFLVFLLALALVIFYLRVLLYTVPFIWFVNKTNGDLSQFSTSDKINSVIVITGWLGIIIYIILTIARKIKFKNDTQKHYTEMYNTLKPQHDAQLALYNEMLSTLRAMENHMNNINNCCIPKKYWAYAQNIVDYIYQDFRASNLKEAINVLENDLNNHAIRQKLSNIENVTIKSSMTLEDILHGVRNIEYEQRWQSFRLDLMWWKL